MNRIAAILTVTVLVFNSSVAFGCSCFPPENASEGLRESDAGFLGRVISVEQFKVRFEVERSWKGILNDEVIISKGDPTNSDKYGLLKCNEFRFEEGETYLVYAYEASTTPEGKYGVKNKFVFAPELYTDRCSRTENVKYAEGDLKELGEGQLSIRKLKRKIPLKAKPNNSLNPAALSLPFINIAACDKVEYHCRAAG